MIGRRIRRCVVVLAVWMLTLPGVLAGATANAAATINGHVVSLDSSGKLLSWVSQPDKAYATVVGLAWNYLLNKVPNDPSTDQPAYLSQSYLYPDTQKMSEWPSDPAGMNSMLIESAMDYYRYSGNDKVLTFAERLANHQLAQGMTEATDDWPNVAYASGEAGTLTYHGSSYGDLSGVGDGTGIIEPDKVAEFGRALLMLFEQTGDSAYRDAAINAADVLAAHVRTGTRTQSPWPFRVNAATGTIREQYTADAIRPVELFDELVRLGLGNDVAYKSARTKAWTWLMAYPMKNDQWSGYYEDVAIHTDTSNHNTMTAMMMARYLLENPKADVNWLSDVKSLISWTEGEFGQSQFGAETIREQTEFAFAMGSHTGQFAEVNALLYEKTGDAAAKATAYRAFNWSTYMTRPSGVVIDGPDVDENGTEWFTDGYGDSIRYYLGGMGAVPAWAPNGQNHVVDSTSVITGISYLPAQITYRTFDNSGTETIKLAEVPTTVTVDGVLARHRGDLGGPGWTYNAATHVLRVRHTSGRDIQVSTGLASALTLVRSPRTLVYGKSARISGHLSAAENHAPLSNAPVRLYTRRHTPHGTAQWTAWRTVTTNARGNFTAVLSRPRSSTDAYVSYAGTSSGPHPLAPSRSAAVAVSVRYHVHARGPRSAVRLGHIGHVIVAVAPAARVSVVLQKWSSHHWRNVSAKFTSHAGAYSFVVRPSRIGTIAMRVKAMASQSVAGNVSNVVKIITKRPHRS
jgi:hypothetical protein